MLRMIGGQAAAKVHRSTEHDDFAAALLGGEFEYLPMPGQPFAATLRTLRVGSVVIQQAADGPHITRAAIQRGLVGLIAPMNYAGRSPNANGMAVTTQDALLVPGGAEFRIACPDPLEWGAVALPAGMVEELAELGATLPRGASPGVLRLAPEVLSELGATFAAAGRMAEEAPNALAAPGCAEGLAASLQELLAGAMTPGFAAPPHGRAGREAMRVVRTAEEYLRANLARPIYQDDLCAALAISRRKLHDAFVAVVGISPSAFLKLRRLTLVRRALRAGDGSRTLVKSIALSHGFWHLGYFAKDYRSLFGEMPSQTVAARAMTPAGLRTKLPIAETESRARPGHGSGVLVP